ncbi:YoaK family protein [Mageeibacillus indolicus]|uniref:YoaK family protein n=1 Tax=Mageeibacillus indolicus TaxID=884684 RepID=UPI0004DD33F8|nr:YoaK family protein [Mageeibacillus indolicus]KFA57307.1 membrane protein [Mageeibacillus indolicus 0009-5]
MKMLKPFGGQMSESFLTALFIILSGGFQDAYTYVCRNEVFANAQTGNIVLLSTAIFKNDWTTFWRYLIPVLSFFIGTAAAESIHMRLKLHEKIHWRQLILLGEIIILLGVGFIPASVEIPANALVSFVCAMQVQTFHKVRGHAYASTMCIGNLRSGVEALCIYARCREREILQKSLTYFAVIMVFAVGAGLGSVLTQALGCRAIWICCVLLSISFGLMFKRCEYN